MKVILHKIGLSVVLLLGLNGVYAQSDIVSAIQTEVDRNRASLKMEGMLPPFFIEYSIHEQHNFTIAATLGSISSVEESHRRYGVPMVLVGDYMRNNLNISGARQLQPENTSLFTASGIPITIWKDLDKAYKSAVEQYKTKMAIMKQQTQDEDESNLPDFEQIEPVEILVQPSVPKFDRGYWEKYLCLASEAAKQYPDVITSNVMLQTQSITTYTYNTEGSRYIVPSPFFHRLRFTLSARAKDGQDIALSFFIDYPTFEQMPDVESFTHQCKEAMESLMQLIEAPVVEDAYNGPVLMEGSAVDALFRQTILNSLSAAPRQIQQSNSLVFNLFGSQRANLEPMLNKKVVHRSFDVKAITGQEFYKGERLSGYYPVDAQGVAPDKELTLIENGVLRQLLNGRQPTKRIPNSNGHARFSIANGGTQVLPGNIIITSSQTFSVEELRNKLIEAAKEEDLDYAYIIRGGNHQGLTLMYKIYVADGREELVRGAVTSNLNLKTLKRILGVSNEEQIVNNANTTLITPRALLLEDVDVNRASNIQFKKPFIVSKPSVR